MKLTTHIRNIIFLCRENRKETVNKKHNIENILTVVQRTYKRKNSWVRNQVALLIRKIRKEKPYKIIDYSQAKALYESTVPIDLSKVKVGSYVVKHSEDNPVKGKRWCEYYINYTSGTGVFKVKEWNDKYKFWRLEDYKGNYGSFSLGIDDGNMFGFATKKEIGEFKFRRKNYKEKMKEIETKQKELSKLYEAL